MYHCLMFLLVWFQIVFAAGPNHGVSATIDDSREFNEESNESLVKMNSQPVLKTFLFDLLKNDSYSEFLEKAFAAKFGPGPSSMTNSNQSGTSNASREPEPEVRGLEFSPKRSDSPPNITSISAFPEDSKHPRDKSPSEEEENDEKEHFIHLMSLLMGSFLGGIFFTTTIGLLLFLYKRKRWKNQNVSIEADLNSPKLSSAISSYVENESDSGDLSQSSSDSLMGRGSVENQMSPAFPRRSFPSCEDLYIAMGPTLSQLPSIQCCSIISDVESCSQGIPERSEQIFYSGDQGGKPYITADDNPFITLLTGLITDEGGVVQSSDSDVCVIIPPGAVQQGLGGVNITVRVKLSDWSLPLPPGNVSDFNQVQLSPVVDISCGSVELFCQPVIVKIPHRAYLSEEQPFSSVPNENHSLLEAPPSDLSAWNLQVLCCSFLNRPRTENSPQWHSIPHYHGSGRPTHPVCFTFDKDFVFVHTTHPVTLVATGCGQSHQKENTPQLKLSALTFGSYKPMVGGDRGRWQATLRMYICDGFADARKTVVTHEKTLGGCRQSPDKDCLIKLGVDAVVSLMESCKAGWIWRLEEEEGTNIKTIPSTVINTCGGPPACAEFRCESTFSSENQPPLLATLNIAVGIKESDKDAIYNILITDSFESTANKNCSI